MPKQNNLLATLPSCCWRSSLINITKLGVPDSCWRSILGNKLKPETREKFVLLGNKASRLLHCPFMQSDQQFFDRQTLFWGHPQRGSEFLQCVVEMQTGNIGAEEPGKHRGDGVCLQGQRQLAWDTGRIIVICSNGVVWDFLSLFWGFLGWCFFVCFLFLTFSPLLPKGPRNSYFKVLISGP